MASSSEAQSYPHQAKVINKQRHPPEVENSICQIIYNLGSPNPKAFVRRWTLEDVIEGLNEVMIAVAGSDDVRNPSGMLWRILEEKDLERKQLTNGGNEQCQKATS